ncbi:squamosa promoter-binding-like protein 9 [Iris pallida]|uniref:Squamosa promoter-binding-like protein 9 n=1 Tax=Iris pallida TaxID=29817 RepID=A0AAX6EYD4_IRIPA|nr:squamosa promoter-binding-like protein 9 [Iris pallida]
MDNWDWNSLLDVSDTDPLVLPWDPPSPPPPPDPPAPTNSPAEAAPTNSRVRKRDPRLVCGNYLAGRIPCACPEMDKLMLGEEEEEAVAGAMEDDGGRKRAKKAAAAPAAEIRCQVAGCGADIRELKGYHRRHRVCLRCASASSVAIDGADRRYCQQCGKFHLLTDFDEDKRSCRRKLEKHNRRRRRKPTDHISLVENEKGPQTDLLEDITRDGESTKEKELASKAVETVLSNKLTGTKMLLESENGHGSPICSLPRSQNEQSDSIVYFAVSGETHIDEGSDNPKSAISSTIRDNKSTYSSVCPTGRISFKLYDWNPAEFPRRLRHQIFQWLDSMPVELEGYIRPGCTILTIFIAMPQFMWEKLSQDASLLIRDLVNAPQSLFLGRGNIFIYLNNMIIHLLKDGASLMNIKMEVKAPRIHYVHPTYFEAGKPMEFVACGSNLDQSKFRFLVSIAGTYLVYDSCHAISHGKIMSYVESQGDSFTSDHETFRVCIKKTDSKLFGPAFIEVENESGISNFIPVLFGNKHICSEVERMQGALVGSLGASPGICKLFEEKQTELAELITDIAWLLKEADMDKWEAVLNATNIQRLTCLLKFSIQNEFVYVLELILKYLDVTVCLWHKLETVIPDLELKLLLEYINHAKEILNRRAVVDARPALDSANTIQRIPDRQINFNSTMNKDVEERNIDGTCSASPSASKEGNENIPFVSKAMVDREHCYQHFQDNWHRESSLSMYSLTVSRTRLSVFVAAAIVMCFVACSVFVHPLNTGGLVVSIRRCLFGDPLP